VYYPIAMSGARLERVFKGYLSYHTIQVFGTVQLGCLAPASAFNSLVSIKNAAETQAMRQLINFSIKAKRWSYLLKEP
jgi:hypothetical protein